MALDIPNLDGMAREDVWKFWEHNHARPRLRARQFWPDRPKGYVRALTDLCHYAANKATAMKCREGGDITGAQTYENICERIYRELPEFAKW